MAVHTKRIILQVFQEMLEEMSFDRITVSALVRRCEISPNTFYYHFQNIYALLEAWLVQWLKEVLPDSELPESRVAAEKSLLHACQDHPKLVNHILDSLSREQIERVVFSLSEDWFHQYIKKVAGDRIVSEKRIQDISDFCRYAFFGFFFRFVRDRMTADVDQAVDELDAYFQCFIHSALAQREG